MSIGIGDIISLGELVVRLYNLLQSVKGAKEEYRTICASLRSLERPVGIAKCLFALPVLDDKSVKEADKRSMGVSIDGNASIYIEILRGIEDEVNALKIILENYEQGLKKYGESLNKFPFQRGATIKDIWRALKWYINHDGAARDFEKRLLCHIIAFWSLMLEVTCLGVFETDKRIQRTDKRVQRTDKRVQRTDERVQTSVKKVDEVKGKVDEVKIGVDEVGGKLEQGFKDVGERFKEMEERLRNMEDEQKAGRFTTSDITYPTLPDCPCNCTHLIESQSDNLVSKYIPPTSVL